MLRKMASFTSQSSSPSPSPVPGSRSSSSASNHHPQPQHHHHHEAAGGVRRAFNNLQSALHHSRSSTMAEKISFESNSELDAQPHQHIHQQHLHTNSTHGTIFANSNYSAHSNATIDSFYSSTSSMTLLTTDDDTSSTASRTPRLRQPRQLSKTGSLPSSPLSTLAQDESTYSLATLTAQQVEDNHVQLVDDGLLVLAPNGHIMNTAVGSAPVQLRVGHFEGGSSYSGYLTKFSSRTFFSRKQWKRRYFILNKRTLHCFKSADPQHPLLESLTLGTDTIICVTDMFSGKRYCLQITCPGDKNWYVLADTAAEMSGWLRELKGTVLRFRSLQLGSRPGTHYSDSSEMSDLSSSSAAMTDGAPSVPSIPSQYDSAITLRSSSPPPHPPYPFQHLHYYQSSSTGNLITHAKSTRRRNNSSATSGSGQLLAENAAFGTVMERADAASPEEEQKQFPFPVLPPAHMPRYQSNSTSTNLTSDMETDTASINLANVRVNSHSRRTSAVERPEMMITLPRRSSQRFMGGSSRPMSPTLSRPTSPSVNRASPRSSLVVSPPPRSIHRPSSIGMRYSTQVSSLQIATAGLPSSNSSIRSLSPNSEYSVDGLQGSLSRVTSTSSIRHLRQSSIVRNNSNSSIGSLKERAQRHSARANALAGLAAFERPLSPPPSLSTAPTTPLPDPPQQVESGPPSIRTLKHSHSNGSSHRISIVPRHHDPDILVSHWSNSRSRIQSQESALVSTMGDLNISADVNAPLKDNLDNTNNTDTEASTVFSPLGPSVLPESPLSRLPVDVNGRIILPAPPAGDQPLPPTSSSASSINNTSRASIRPSSYRRSLHKHSLSTSSICSIASSTSSSVIAFSSGGSTGSPAYGSGVARKHSSKDSIHSIRLSILAPIPLGSAAAAPSPPQRALPPIPVQTSLNALPTPPNSMPSAVQHDTIEPMGDKVPSKASMTDNETSTGVKEDPEPASVNEDKEDDKDRDVQSTEEAEEFTIVGFEMILEEEEETYRDSDEETQEETNNILCPQILIQDKRPDLVVGAGTMRETLDVATERRDVDTKDTKDEADTEIEELAVKVMKETKDESFSGANAVVAVFEVSSAMNKETELVAQSVVPAESSKSR
ncbi:hypothetical protein BGZ50_000458 [Haplosporangium sp. Z 11]|nr:hypothetical protein BGZ50_000458 [Haplosporangium sp. Z 11]